jgi:hypothetical protein
VSTVTYQSWGDGAYPIIGGRLTGDVLEETGVAGTGFVPVDGVLVTCWHCVRGCEDGLTYAIAVSGSATGMAPVTLTRLTQIERDPAGADLATAVTTLGASALMNLSPTSEMLGQPMWSVGFPMPEIVRPTTIGEPTYTELSVRHLKGYVVREFLNGRHPNYGPQESYELDMLTPEGMSGAPCSLTALAQSDSGWREWSTAITMPTQSRTRRLSILRLESDRLKRAGTSRSGWRTPGSR